MEYRHFKVRYIDKWTKGEIRETEIHGYYDETSVISHFGLKDPDVFWYEITEINKEHYERKT